MRSEALDRMKYFYGMTDGNYRFPNSAEGDLLKICLKEIKELLERIELLEAQMNTNEVCDTET